VLMGNFTLDTAKNCFLVYFFARRALKLWRHVRARGLFQSFRDIYTFIAQVFIYLTLYLPSLRHSSLC
jgi:sphinganine-1-phosphate aldolase